MWSDSKDFSYKAGLEFETLAQFKWNVSEQLAEETYETIAMDFEPGVEVYGFLETYGTVQYGSWVGASLKLEIVPLDI